MAVDAGLSFQPGSTQTGGTPASALAPLQSAVQVLSLNLPSAAARNFSPLASNGPSARGFNPEALVAQTLLKSLTGSGIPNQVLMDHLSTMLSSVGQSVPTTPPAPTVTPGSNNQMGPLPGGGVRLGAPAPPMATTNGSGDAAVGGLAAGGGRVA